MKKLAKIVFTLLFLFLLLPTISYGQLITISITGYITSVSGSGLPASIQVGDIFTATYTYDSSMTDSDSANEKFGEYLYNAPYGISVSLGDYEFKTDTTHTGEFSVSLDLYYANRYYYKVNSAQNISSPTGIAIKEISWILGDSSRSAISTDDLIITTPTLTDWDYNVFKIVGEDNSFIINGTVTQVVLVPEPLTATLILMGVILSKRRR